MRAMRVSLVLLLGGLLLASLPAAATSASTSPRFLALPFPKTWRMDIEAGWWRSPGERHDGIDYVRGDAERPWTWQRFPVLAAASGWACAAREASNACIDGVGARIVIRHRAGGRTWYTYYGHMATSTISDRIPLDRDRYSVWVRKGEYLGMAGRTGYPGTGIHLHFQVITLPFRSWDPYDLYAGTARYPNPQGTDGKRCGPDRLWEHCPPTPPDEVTGIPRSSGQAAADATGSPDAAPSATFAVAPASVADLAAAARLARDLPRRQPLPTHRVLVG